MGEGFLIAGVCQVVAELGVHFGAVRGGPSRNFLGNRLQGGEVSGGISVSPSVVGDDGDAAAEQGDECSGHERRDVGN